MAFDLEEFRASLLESVSVDHGEEMSMALVVSELLPDQDMQAFFKAKGVDVKKMDDMLEKEAEQRYNKNQRAVEHRGEEDNDFEKEHAFQMGERVHELVNNVELRAMAHETEATAVDVFKEALRLALNDELVHIGHPANRDVLSPLAADAPIEYAGVKTFELLGIKPYEFFEDLMQKLEQQTKSHAVKAGRAPLRSQRNTPS